MALWSFGILLNKIKQFILDLHSNQNFYKTNNKKINLKKSTSLLSINSSLSTSLNISNFSRSDNDFTNFVDKIVKDIKDIAKNKNVGQYNNIGHNFEDRKFLRFF
jgi:Holliday junction resolvasome RuvABC ATP-dependent DNA helicase subunit